MGTAAAPTWPQLGRLSLIPVIRTFLAYFLEREMKESEREMREPGDV